MLNDDKTELLLVGSQKQLAKVSVVCFAKWSMKTSQTTLATPSSYITSRGSVGISAPEARKYL